ncbi:hypothetical protein [Aliikangiella maris]|uniref:Uncharacterized protein n=2 Tax=Aliikangiella maris TaxID=3162458 RepID=A0ABV2BU60_9GAMM
MINLIIIITLMTIYFMVCQLFVFYADKNLSQLLKIKLAKDKNFKISKNFLKTNRLYLRLWLPAAYLRFKYSSDNLSRKVKKSGIKI